LLAQAFPLARVAGLDFAERAIEEARRRHPKREFILTHNGEIARDFDCIITSNCLEHFVMPLHLVGTHLRACKYLYIALVAYEEYPLHEQHRSQFREESFPARLSQFVRLYAKTIEVNQTYWPGRQLLAVYGSPDYLAEVARAHSGGPGREGG